MDHTVAFKGLVALHSIGEQPCDAAVSGGGHFVKFVEAQERRGPRIARPTSATFTHKRGNALQRTRAQALRLWGIGAN
jgi:hypothetical protein